MFAKKSTTINQLRHTLSFLLLMMILAACIRPSTDSSTTAEGEGLNNPTVTSNIAHYPPPCPQMLNKTQNDSICFTIFGPISEEFAPRPTELYSQKAYAYIAIFDRNVNLWQVATLDLNFDTKMSTHSAYVVMAKPMLTCYKFWMEDLGHGRTDPILGEIYLQEAGGATLNNQNNSWQFSKDVGPEDVIATRLEKGEQKKTVTINFSRGYGNSHIDNQDRSMIVTSDMPEQVISVPIYVRAIKVIVDIETQKGEHSSYETRELIDVNKGPRSHYFNIEVQDSNVAVKPITCHEDGEWK